MIDYIADYLDTIESRRVTPNIEPGYLKKLLPLEAPQKPEDWNVIMDDVEKKIMPGVGFHQRKIDVMKLRWKNYKDISLLSVVRKIYGEVLVDRLSKVTG